MSFLGFLNEYIVSYDMSATATIPDKSERWDYAPQFTKWGDPQPISRELFEAWLLSQPDHRVFDFIRADKCAIAMFLLETRQIRHNRDYIWTVGNIQKYGGEWLYTLVNKCVPTLFSAGQLKAAYLAMFPETINAGSPNRTGGACHNVSPAGSNPAPAPELVNA